MRNVAFTPIAFQEYNDWFDTNEHLVVRIKALIKDIDRDPFRGIGKPEPLKGNWAGYWSRQIDQEHQAHLQNIRYPNPYC